VFRIANSFGIGLVCSALTFSLGFASLSSAGKEPIRQAPPSLRERLTGFRVGAHRGGMPFPDQNTIHRFEQARQSGVDIVETDLRVSRDGEVFLFHDRMMDDLTTCSGPIAAKSASEIRACRLRGTALGLSTFRELLTWSAGRVVIDADVKNNETLEPAIQLVREMNAYLWVYVQVQGSYDRARIDDARVALLVSPKGPMAQQQLDYYLAQKDANLLIIELPRSLCNAENIRAIHQSGKIASADSWHFGSERSWWHRRARCDQVFGLGIDIAISDLPEGCVGEKIQADRDHGM